MELCYIKINVEFKGKRRDGELYDANGIYDTDSKTLIIKAGTKWTATVTEKDKHIIDLINKNRANIVKEGYVDSATLTFIKDYLVKPKSESYTHIRDAGEIICGTGRKVDESWYVNQFKIPLMPLVAFLESTNQNNKAETPIHSALDELVIYGKSDNKLVFNTGFRSSYSPNRIIFGAPGTGKSHTLDEERKKLLGDNNEECYERVTFHPDYSYANFVGTYKPVMVANKNNFSAEVKKVISVLADKGKTAQQKYDELYDDFKDEGLTRLPILIGLYSDENFTTKKLNGEVAANDNSVEKNHGKAIRKYVQLINLQESDGKIAYEYVPGPFMRVYVKALKSAMAGECKPYLLIIEEINRANVAAVFGDNNLIALLNGHRILFSAGADCGNAHKFGLFLRGCGDEEPGSGRFLRLHRSEQNLICKWFDSHNKFHLCKILITVLALFTSEC